MKRLLTSCFGLGFLPVAPGTWGSLFPVVIFIAMNLLGFSTVTVSIVMLLMVVTASFICVKLAPFVITQTSKDDPSEIVIDEVGGQGLTFIGINMAHGWMILLIAILGFILFRFFDISKLWPIRKLERLPKGWGILADDLLAGIYAAIVLQAIIRIWPV